MGVVVIDEGGFGSTNQSIWYQNGGTHLSFPELNIDINAWVYDENANGMIGNIVITEPCYYTLLSPTTVRINFTARAKGRGFVAAGFSWGVYFAQNGEPTQLSNIYTTTTGNAENVNYRNIEFEMICLVDITTLGVPLGAFAEDTYATIIG